MDGYIVEIINPVVLNLEFFMEILKNHKKF